MSDLLHQSSSSSSKPQLPSISPRNTTFPPLSLRHGSSSEGVLHASPQSAYSVTTEHRRISDMFGAPKEGSLEPLAGSTKRKRSSLPALGRIDTGGRERANNMGSVRLGSVRTNSEEQEEDGKAVMGQGGQPSLTSMFGQGVLLPSR